MYRSSFDEPGPSQHVEVLGQSRPGDFDGFLDFPDRHISSGLYQDEEHLEAAEVRERLERFYVDVIGR
jgi:hypothetical protein